MSKFLYQKHNFWWQDADKIKEDIVLQQLNQQKYQYKHFLLEEFPQKEGIIVLRGARRIGKTTLLKQIIRMLILKRKVNSKNTFYYPCDRIADYNQLYDLIVGYLGRKTKGHRYLFLDEISFVSHWQRAVKDLADSGDLANCSLVLTGSNALDLRISSERLPGRRGRIYRQDIIYWPLDFANFVRLVDADYSLEKFLNDYLICGGFPQAINEYYQQGFISNFLYDVYLQWIEGDLHKIDKSEKTGYMIFSEILKHLGSRVSWYKIAKNAGIGSHSTVREYIDIFEKTFVCFALNYYSVDQSKVFINKNKKIYFTDPIIYWAVKAKIANFTDRIFSFSQEQLKKQQEKPALIENLVGAYLYRMDGSLYYGNYQGREIDFVLRRGEKEEFYEVKYRNNIKMSNFRFWDKNQSLTVITKNFKFKKENLRFVPLKDFLTAFNTGC